MIKRIVTTAIGVGLLLATVFPAFAANQCANTTTGPSSWNICHRDASKFKVINLNNSGNVTHNLTSNTTTGNNTSSKNTNGGSVKAGKASAVIAKMVSLNTGNLTASQADSGTVLEEQGMNDNTGPSSNNTVNLVTTKNLTLNLTNTGNVTQHGEVLVSSGHNDSSNNTVGGLVETGDSSSEVTIQTIMNDFNITLNQ